MLQMLGVHCEFKNLFGFFSSLNLNHEVLDLFLLHARFLDYVSFFSLLILSNHGTS